MEYIAQAIRQSLETLLYDAASFVPQLVVAIIVVVIGWILGGMFGGVVTRVFKMLRLDDALDKAGVDELSKRAGFAFKPAVFAGSLVKWFVILAFFVVALDVLNLQEVTAFMRLVVLTYLPQVFAALLILFAGILAASFARTAIAGLVRSSSSTNHSPEFFGKVAYYAVLAFTVMAVLNQLQIADELVETLFVGIVFGVSLAFGLAFGLGGKDAAARYIDKTTNKSQ